jgi:hypothetical protein
MNTPPQADIEYSRGSAILRGLPGWRRGLAAWRRRDSQPAPREPFEPPPAALAGVVLCALLGALLVLVSQFTPLYHVHPGTSPVPIKTVGTGASHTYAPVPLALLAVCFALAVALYRSRSSLLGLLVLGLATLAIALLSDLPAAHSSGLIGSGASEYVPDTSSPSAGLYMETLGAVLLMIGGGLGLLMVAGRQRSAS